MQTIRNIDAGNQATALNLEYRVKLRRSICRAAKISIRLPYNMRLNCRTARMAMVEGVVSAPLLPLVAHGCKVRFASSTAAQLMVLVDTFHSIVAPKGLSRPVQRCLAKSSG